MIYYREDFTNKTIGSLCYDYKDKGRIKTLIVFIGYPSDHKTSTLQGLLSEAFANIINRIKELQKK